MIYGFTLVSIACFIWGLIFVVPLFMDGFSSLEIALGRYFFYGIISLAIFSVQISRGKCSHSTAIWKNAFLFALLANIVYYTGLVLGLRYASPSVTALIVGLGPITIAFYGNFQQRECEFKRLILPSAIILCGLLLVNIPAFENNVSLATWKEYFFGLACACSALVAWTWYVVKNARFLKANPQLSARDWATVLGVATFCWVLGFISLLLLLNYSELGLQSTLNFNNQQLTHFIIGASILGLFCSWIGSSLWNAASVRLPVSLAGSLTIMETIFGLSFVYIVEGRVPPLIEITGIGMMLIGIFVCINTFKIKKVEAIEVIQEQAVPQE